ncbi:MAG TPA: glycosyltransferase [Candidatus Kapabacteria bacterium]|nr:glycosyltransferase [Candidatus Kapabacteria bacterium]
MKILYVGHTYTVRANQAKIAALAAMPWPNGSVEITLVTPHGWRGPLYSNRADLFDRSLATNVDHHILRAFFIGKEGAYLFSPSIFLLIAKLKPDIVHVEQGAYALSYAQIILALKLFSPQSRAIFFTWWNLPYRPRGLKRMTERFNLSHSACAIAGNEAAREVLREHGFHNPIEVLPQLGVDERMLDLPCSNALDHNSFTVGYAGRISPEKGVLDLVEAIGKLKQPNEVKLYMVGSGDALEDVRNAAAVHRVHFVHHPAIRNEELPDHLAKMDVLVLPSRTTPEWVEQFGHILLEAMAMGVPVIGSSSGEIPNVISNAGLIFEEGNILELSARIEWLRSNPSERERLSDFGKARVREHFTNRIIAAAQLRVYQWMMKSGKPAGARQETHSNERRRTIPTATNE